MKRRAGACAAANDDEDLGGLFKAPRTKLTPSDAKADDQAPAPAAKRKKAKEFAWMESDEEEEGGPANDEEEEAEKAESDDGEYVDHAALEAVQSFGRMMLLAPTLRKQLQALAQEGSPSSGKLAGGSFNFGPSEVAAACRALARTKFFDPELLTDLGASVRRLLREDRMETVQVNDIIMCLWALNAYEKSVFSAIAAVYKARLIGLDAAVRNSWLEVYRGFSHAADPDFLQLLEVPPEPITSPRYGKLRCKFFERGCCALDKSCSFAHDLKAPLFLDSEPNAFIRAKPLVMTHNQKNMGLPGTYGLGGGGAR